MKLGRSEVSDPKIDLVEFVDVEKAKHYPIHELPVVDYSVFHLKYAMFLNDTLGDCTVAGIAHGKQTFDAMVGKPFNVHDQDILRMYEASGYNPDDESTDQGWTLEAAAQYSMRKGLQGKPDILGYAKVSLRDDDAQQVAAELFGGLYVGAAMPITAQKQNAQGQVWTPVSGSDGQPGSWGGHCLWKPKAVLRKGSLYITWGMLQASSAAWDDEYVDEYMALVPADWENRMPENLVKAGIVDFTKLRSLVGKFK